jgi:predicted MFS family arabinose efflux permease
MSPSGREAGPFLSLEQAILPDTTKPERRTSVFASYNLINALAGALGALAAGVPALVGLSSLAGYKLLIWLYVATGLTLALIFQRLSPRIEVASTAVTRPKQRIGLHRSRGMVLKLSALFALDSFAGGFVLQGLLAYWLNLRFGADAASLAAIFFALNLAAALTFPIAVPIARRIGLLNTMVFTQVPANLMFFLVPLMPNLWSAVAILVLRSLISQLDIPTRQSYTMAVVEPDERSAAAGITAVARNSGSALSPLFTGIVLSTPVLGLPFLVAGTLKLVYDAMILTMFRNIRPPEELRQPAPKLPQPAGSTQGDSLD